ncbi:MAG: CpsD/CapB family tyrosine-protein kinase [Alphaproteobacteria bacterium]|nr:CpsD/CapB family tyrosine-protein kinase [Alphaproteobacteria bacterium]
MIECPDSPYAEAMWSLLASLEMSMPAQEPMVVLVTSALHGAGKTGFAVSLARSAAQSGHRTLLIDCNLRQPGVAKLLQCADAQGLDAVVAGETLSESPIRADAASSLRVLPTRASTRVHDTLSSPTFRALVDEARRHYDLVVLDGPALMQGPDSLVLCQLSDVGLVLVPWRRTRINALLRAFHRVAAPSGKRLATLLTDVPVDRYQRYQRGLIM